jgi:DnaJ-class molecular chaperone
MRDPYEVLGVERTATDAQITSAYRKLAKKHHPDVNPGQKDAEDRFKEIAQAYDLLSDKDKRARFDRGEIDASGQEKAPERNFYRGYGDDTGRTKYRTYTQSGDGADIDLDEFDLESIFGEAMRRGGSHGFAGGFSGGGFRARGGDMRYALMVDFLTAANGGVRRLTLPDGKTLDVTIPAGLKDGQVLRLKGKGQPGIGGEPPGDALIEVGVAPHPVFRRDGDDVIVEVPITLKEAVLGAKIDVPTLTGTVSVTVPPNAQSGRRLRLRGKGIKGGHQQVELKVVLPSGEEPELAAFLKTWTPHDSRNPRDELYREAKTEATS